MPRFSFRVGTAATVFALAACGSTSDLEELQNTEPKGSQFSQALSVEYREFATREADVEYDWLDQQFFARKGLKAAKGEEPPPEEIKDWDIDDPEVAEIQAARDKLVTALDGGGRANHPAEAAKAQAKFDCWIEQQEEAWQTEDIAACKGEFQTALAELDDVMTLVEDPPAEEQPLVPAARPEPATFRIQFRFDSATLDPAARAEIRAAAAAAGERDGAVVTVVGHTDRAGDATYNQTLSKRRAEAVADGLRDDGLGSNLTVRYVGEADPEVPTADGIMEPRNRRVTILVR